MLLPLAPERVTLPEPLWNLLTGVMVEDKLTDADGWRPESPTTRRGKLEEAEVASDEWLPDPSP